MPIRRSPLFSNDWPKPGDPGVSIHRDQDLSRTSLRSVSMARI